MWKNNVLPRIVKNELSDYQNLLLSFNIFYYVSIYIKDMNVFHTVILPFLIDVIKDYEKLGENKVNFIVNKFITSILINISEHEAQKNAGYFIFEHLSVEILERGIRMGQNLNNEQFLKEWEYLMKLFISLLKCDLICNLLFEVGTLEVFRNVFNCNWFHMGQMLEFLFAKHKNICNSNSNYSLH